MINGERLLGALLKQGLGGNRSRGRRRSGLDSLFGSTTKTMLGMGALGVAIAAFDHFTQGSSSSSSRSGPPPLRPTGSKPPPPPPLEGSETGPGPLAVPGGTAVDQRVKPDEEVLLIRAMIAAANADGKIDGDEMDAIINYLGQAGMTGEERNFIEKELASPKSIDSILPQVQGEELANRLYAVSLLAIKVDTKAERDYLRYLRARLGIKGETARELHGQLGLPEEDGDSGDSAELK